MVFDLKDTSAVREFLDLVPLRTNYVKKMVAISGYSRLMVKSPVLTGRYRWGWNCSIGAIDYSVPDPAPKEYAKNHQVYYDVDGDRAIKSFVQVKLDENIFIANSLPYAEAIENGHSRQAPAGVARIVVEELKGDIIKFAAKAKGKDGGL